MRRGMAPAALKASRSAAKGCDFECPSSRNESAHESAALRQIAPEKVLHCCMEPVFRPRVNQFTRCCDVPWVKLSGTA